MGATPPELGRKFMITVAVRFQDPPKYEPSLRASRGVPGTGSTYLGMSMVTYDPQGTGHSGTNNTMVIQHSAIDMLSMSGPLDPRKLPFTLETRATLTEHAIPVFLWLPLSFDPTKAPKKLSSKDLPDGTIIVYAVINEK